MHLMFAMVMLAVAIGIWFVFLRPVPTAMARGVVIEKFYRPEGTYWQYHAGDRRGFRGPTPIAIAESYSLTLQWDHAPRTAQVSVNMAESDRFQIGTPVQFEYVIRGIPLFWTRVYVLNVSPLAAANDE